MCGDCRISTPVGFKCRRCVGTAHSDQDQRKEQRSGGGGGAWATRNRLIAAGAAIAVVAAVVVFAATRGGSQGSGSTFARSNVKGTGSNTELSIQFQGSGGAKIGGNLLLPPGAGTKTPGVVIVPDGGTSDRNGFSPTNAVADPLYAELAKVLAHDGVASLRYDRRGHGQSVQASGATITLPDVVGDAKAALGFLAGRVDVNRSRLALIGDGQGGLVAEQVAATDTSAKAVVLISTPGRDLLSTMSDRLTSVANTPEFAQQLVSQLQAVVSALSAGGAVPPQSQLPGPLQALLPSGEDGYLRSLFAVSPPALAQMVRVPLLIVQGGADPSLAPADAQALAQGAGPSAQVLVVPGDGPTLNHLPETAAASTTTTTPSGTPILRGLGSGGSVVRDDQTLGTIASFLTAHS